MGKKCIICEEEAQFCIKNTSDFYCYECAQENFSDIALLEKLQKEANALKNYLDNKVEDVHYVENEKVVHDDSKKYNHGFEEELQDESESTESDDS